MNNNQGSSGLFSTFFATTGALALAAGGYAMAKHQQAPRPESKQKSERPAEESPEVLAERLRYQEERSKLATELALLKQELVGLKKAQDISQGENTRLTTRLQQAEAKEKASSAQLVARAGELAEAKQTSANQAQQISTLSARAESAEAKQVQLSEEVVATQEKAASLESKFTNSQKALSALQEQLTAKESQLAEVTQASTEQTQQIRTLNARAESAEANEKTSSEKLVAAQEQVTSLEKNLSGSKKEVALLEAEVEALRSLSESEPKRLTQEALQQKAGSRRDSFTSQCSSSPAPSCSSMRSSMSRFDSGSDAKIRMPACAKNKQNHNGAEASLRFFLYAGDSTISRYGLKMYLVKVLGFKSAADLEPVYRLSSAHFKSEQIAEVKSLKVSTDRISLYHDDHAQDDDFDRHSNASSSVSSARPTHHLGLGSPQGTPPPHAGTPRFGFARQERRGSASGQHNRFNSRASNTSLTSNQGEGGSRTPSFSQN